MLSRTEPNPDKDSEALRVIERNGRELLTLINDILDLSRIEAGRLNLELGEVDPASLVEEAVQTIRPAAEAKGLRLVVRRVEAIALESDAARIRQILLNLLSNAVKFTDRGEIEVAVTAHAEQVRFAVRDTGIGVRPEDREIIFDEFRQADGTSTRKHGGSGLGLAICDKLAKLIGGEVTLVSEVGVGSTFSLLVPRRRARAEEGRAEEAGAGDRSEATVLVIGDDEEGSRDVQDFLRRNRHEVAGAIGGEAGLRMARALRPRAIVLDEGRAGDPWAVLRALKSAAETGEIPVVVTAAPEQRSAAESAGAAGFLAKPVDRELLLRSLAGLVR
jgi:hypothetical protein